ncbi:hypothetical protein [Peribacillus kribbensis]|uniref:hypothetical protein n=1 Tax=Peribacillus kribbensis TaxID=356658 RepID=UPI0004291706|nr:hypothetical protein [Peribacillus kribbensis]
MFAKLLSCNFLAILLLCTSSTALAHHGQKSDIIAAASAGLSTNDLEEVLIKQLHSQISEVIMKVYNVEIPQYKNARILLVKKEALQETSEQLKPAIIHIVKVRVDVIEREKTASLDITFTDNNSEGRLAVKNMKKVKLP